MKKVTKLFLLALCSWLLFLWFSNAQSWIHENPYITEDNTVVNANNSDINENVNSESYSIDDFIWYSQAGTMTCFEWISIVGSSYLLLILIWLILILLSLCSIPLYKKFKDTNKISQFFRLPLLNIYPLFKITIGKIRFYYIIVYLLFLICILIYDHVVYHVCYDGKILRYPLLIWGFSSIIILLILWNKLVFLYKWDSNKKDPDK